MKIFYGEKCMLILDVPYQEKDEAKILGARWFLNCYDNCNQQQSNYKLFDDDTPFESPFFVDSEEKAKKLLIYKIKLRNDIIITKPEDSSVFFNSCHWLLKQYADIIPLDIEC